MSFLKKIGSVVGIGGAKIDTVLDSAVVTQGENVSGKVVIMGGNTDQIIDKLQILVYTQVKKKCDEDDSIYFEKEAFQLHEIQGPIKVEAEYEYDVEFSFCLHGEAPITSINPTGENSCHVWLETSADIPMAVDPSDTDYLVVSPCEHVKSILNYLTNEAGYTIAKADVENGTATAPEFQTSTGFYQEIELKKDGKELELTFMLSVESQALGCLLEVDNGGDDEYASFFVSTSTCASEAHEALPKHLL
ncbi:sporulation protein [Vibrio fortis]|uniref:sporulation protein n=1 Tax=Vibrio fortis TaxID=212667 RepID=UPI00406888F0